MTATLNQLIESFRNEVQHYGELLAQFEAQQGLVCQPGPGSLVGSILGLQSQADRLQQARASRDLLQRQLAWSCGRPEPASPALGELLPLLPVDYRPLITALSEEVDQLMAHARARASQNYSQLQRSLDHMERVLSCFTPEVPPTAPPTTGPANSPTDLLPSTPVHAGQP